MLQGDILEQGFVALGPSVFTEGSGRSGEKQLKGVYSAEVSLRAK